MQGKLKKIGNEYKLYAQDDSCIATNHESPYKKLSLKNCEAIANGYDLDELSWKEFPYHEWEYSNGSFGDINEENRETFKIGFQKALEILGDKKFSKNKLLIDFVYFLNDRHFNKYIVDTDEVDLYLESLQQTEWDVEIVMDKDCYSSAGRCDKLTMADCIICTPVTYLKDADGCLILKRK